MCGSVGVAIRVRVAVMVLPLSVYGFVGISIRVCVCGCAVKCSRLHCKVVISPESFQLSAVFSTGNEKMNITHGKTVN